MIYFYLICCTQLYFVCEWLKTTSVIPKRTHHMKNCIQTFTPYLSNKHLFEVCDQLNYQSNFDLFIKNLLYTNLCVYVLVREWVTPLSTRYCCEYWCVGFTTAIVYSLLDNFRLFQFSISSTSHTTTYQTLIIAGIMCFVVCLLSWQWYHQKINYRLVITPIMVYGFIFLLMCIVASDIRYHFHHALIAGTISLCFTDLTLRMNRWVHAVCIGLVIQGLNFYTVEEIFLFNTEYLPPPTFSYMTWLCCLFPLFVVGIMRGKKFLPMVHNLLRRKREQQPEPYEFPLLPTRREMDMG